MGVIVLMEFYLINQVYIIYHFFIKIKKGYWKANILTKNIYPCAPFPNSCLEINNNTHNICETGYIGPLCQTCDHNFAKYGGKLCGSCYSKEKNYILLIATFIAFLIILSIYIKSFFFLSSINHYLFIRLNYNTSMNLQNKNFALKKMILGAYIKIFVNYSQTISIINTLNLNWDQQISDMFNLHKVISGGIQEVIALECLLKGYFNFKLSHFNYFC